MLELLGRDYIYDHYMSFMRNKCKKETVEHYIALALYAISNGKVINQTLSEIIENSSQKQEALDGYETAEQVAAKLGTKINWKGGENV